MVVRFRLRAIWMIARTIESVAGLVFQVADK
jgi:hypothetical protein